MSGPRVVNFRIGGRRFPPNPTAVGPSPTPAPLGATVNYGPNRSTNQIIDQVRSGVTWALHSLVNPGRPNFRPIQPYVAWQTYNTPPPKRVTRLWNPHMRTYKGLKNWGGSNNNDSLYLPRVVRFNLRRSASPMAIQYLHGTKSLNGHQPIRSVFVPLGLH